MPIDDVLADLQPPEKKPEPPQPPITSDDLFTRAQTLLGTFLVDHVIPQPLLETLESSWRKIAPFILILTPSYYTQTACALEHTTCQDMRKSTLISILKSLGTGHLANTDLANELPEFLDLQQEGKRYFPELLAFEKLLPHHLTCDQPSPYLYVLGMPPSLRPLMAVTVEQTLAQRQKKTTSSLPLFKEQLLRRLPSLEILAETAKDYRISEDLKLAIEKFNTSVARYAEARQA